MLHCRGAKPSTVGAAEELVSRAAVTSTSRKRVLLVKDSFIPSCEMFLNSNNDTISIISVSALLFTTSVVDNLYIRCTPQYYHIFQPTRWDDNDTTLSP